MDIQMDGQCENSIPTPQKHSSQGYNWRSSMRKQTLPVMKSNYISFNIKKNLKAYVSRKDLPYST